jgi:hypothetical protein
LLTNILYVNDVAPDFRIVAWSGLLILIGFLLYGTFNRKTVRFRKE